MEKYNLRNPAVKRIVQELKEIQRDDNPDIVAEANEDNIFEWNFAIRGAWDTEFEGGIYHGRIIMPADYPFKPPAFMMLSQSGRFETNVKICLSISSHHPESWQPSWSVRSALVALIAFMQSPGHGALGSLDHPKDVRQQLAAAAREKPPQCGNQDRQKVVDELHQRMLLMEQRSRQLSHPSSSSAPEAAAAAPAASHTSSAAEGTEQSMGGASPGVDALGNSQAAPPTQQGGSQQAQQGGHGADVHMQAGAAGGGSDGGAVGQEARLRQRHGVAGHQPVAGFGASPEQPASSQLPDAAAPQRGAAPPAVAPVPAPALARPVVQNQGTARHVQQGTAYEDRLLTWLAAVLVAGILALVCRRLVGAVTGGLLGEGMPGGGRGAFGDSQL